MQSSFEDLISSFLENKIGISNSFLSNDLALKLKTNLLTLYKQKDLKAASIGNDYLLNTDDTIRRDKIFQLDKCSNNYSEKLFFELIDAFVLYLNSTCFTGIRSYEFHYAMYEKGTFYKKHLDQFKTDTGRAFSMVMYLNESWRVKDGGQLKVYLEPKFEIISPENKKCVFFRSNELAHEVLLTSVSRMSITGWLKTSL